MNINNVHWTLSLFKSLTAEGKLALECTWMYLWNVLENNLDPKKKLPPDGTLLELKMGGELAKGTPGTQNGGWAC